MAGLGALALGAAPLAGGLLVGGMAGRGGPSAPDLRAIIKSELDLLERIPEDQVTRRAALEQVIAQHIDALVVAIEKSRQLQRRTSYLTENWRDLVLVLTTVLFTVVAWQADHHRPLWLPIIIAAILMSVVTALYVLRGFLRHVRAAPHGDHDQRDRHP
jgi:ABC-type xylose transport system permease subunit